jgi:two-component system response regulator (stage 0 sporulation protein A)
MTKLEKTVEALRRCVSAAEFEKALAEVEAAEGETTPAYDVEKTARELLTELGTPDHIAGHGYTVTALLMAVKDPGLLKAVTGKLYPGVAAVYNTTGSRVERAIRHAVELTWDRANTDVLAKYFGNTVHPDKGKPMNSEFLARLGSVIRQKVKEGQAHGGNE